MWLLRAVAGAESSRYIEWVAKRQGVSPGVRNVFCSGKEKANNNKLRFQLTPFKLFTFIIFNIYFCYPVLYTRPGLSPGCSFVWPFSGQRAKWSQKLNFYYLPYCLTIKLMIITAIARPPQASIKNLFGVKGSRTHFVVISPFHRGASSIIKTKWKIKYISGQKEKN